MILTVLAIAMATGYVPPLWSTTTTVGGGLVTETVKRGPFQIVVTERGQLDSMRNAIVTCKVEGSSTIISIVPEGQHVKTGDVICELDKSQLVEKRSQQIIAVEKARASLTQAEKNRDIQLTTNESNEAAAELKLDLAVLDLKRYVEEDYKQQLEELESQVTLKKEALAKAQDEYEYVKRLVRKGFETQNRLDTARNALLTAELELKIADGKREVFTGYNRERQLKELEANAKEFKREIARVKAQSEAALAQKQAELSASKLTMQVEEDKLTKLESQIVECTIRAPQDGQVVYANARDSRSSDAPLIQEGASVRERQAIINLPDYDQMKVNARIHESRISLIRQGLPVTIKVDAYPDLVFQGEVDSVASVPTSTSSFVRDVKEYEAIVRLSETGDGVKNLRTGLTAQIDVLVEQRDAVLQAPVQAIVSVAGKQFAYVLGAEKVERRALVVGQTNDRVVEVLDGLAEDDVVVMNPRTTFARELGELEAQLIREKQDVEAESVPKDANRPAPAATPLSDPTPTASAPADASAGPPAGGARGGFDPATMFANQDTNNDGKLTADEVSERMKPNFAQADTNSDGGITREEFLAYIEARRAAGGFSGNRPASN